MPLANKRCRELDWTVEETEAATGGAGGETTTHLWEESWDDDDTSDDFSAQLKYVSHLTPAIHMQNVVKDGTLTDFLLQRRVEESRGIEAEIGRPFTRRKRR